MKGKRPVDDLLAASLAAGATVAEAAAAANVGESTVYRRLKDSEFKAKVRELRDSMVARAAGKLSDLMTAAVGVLEELLSSTTESIRLRAAVSTIDQAVRLKEIYELADRIKVLEERLPQ